MVFFLAWWDANARSWSREMRRPTTLNAIGVELEVAKNGSATRRTMSLRSLIWW